MSEGGGDQQQELPGGGVDSDDAPVVDASASYTPAPRRGCAFAAFVEAALEDVSNAAGSCRGAHYKGVKAACQVALGELIETMVPFDESMVRWSKNSNASLSLSLFCCCFRRSFSLARSLGAGMTRVGASLCESGARKER